MDYTWPSVYFAYLFFALMFGLFVFLFARSIRDGYFSKSGEDVKYHMFEEEVPRHE
jgi:hypothetical protein